MEGPTFAPNGPGAAFYRETRAGAGGAGYSARLAQIDIAGSTSAKIATPTDATDRPGPRSRVMTAETLLHEQGTPDEPKLLSALAGVALLAACSSDENAAATTGTGGSAGAGGVGGLPPRQPEDLVANVGDRVFFDTDSSVVRGAGGHDGEAGRQAGWLGRYPQVTVGGRS
jgi:hypothetical protein